MSLEWSFDGYGLVWSGLGGLYIMWILYGFSGGG